MFFVGLSAGLVTMYKLMGDKIEVNIKRIKTKKGSSEVSIPVNIESPQKRTKRANKRKRNGGTVAEE